MQKNYNKKGLVAKSMGMVVLWFRLHFLRWLCTDIMEYIYEDCSESSTNRLEMELQSKQKNAHYKATSV